MQFLATILVMTPGISAAEVYLGSLSINGAVNLMVVGCLTWNLHVTVYYFPPSRYLKGRRHP